MKLHVFASIALLALCGQIANAQESDAVNGTIAVTSFNLSSNVIEIPLKGNSEFSLTWQTSGTATAGMYMVAGYIYPADLKVRKPSDSNRFFVQNCTVLSVCGSPHEQKCTVGSSGRISCSPGGGFVVKPGRYVAVARACVIESLTKETCSEREQPFSVR